FAVDRQEHCVRSGAPPATVSYPLPPRLLTFKDAAGHVELRYRAATGGFFVVATTFDPGWRAAVDGAPRRVYPTAAGQLGGGLPAGGDRLLLGDPGRAAPPR